MKLYFLNDDLWRLKFCIIYWIAVFKCSAARKAKVEQAAVNREKDREIYNLFNSLSFQYFCLAFCNHNSIFVRFSLICIESLAFLEPIQVRLSNWNTIVNNIQKFFSLFSKLACKYFFDRFYRYVKPYQGF